MSAGDRTSKQATTPWPDPQPGAGRHQRDVHVHLVLADRRHRPLRPGQHGLLHRRDRRVADRQGRPLVHPRRHALQLRRAQRLHRELRHVRPRRRLPDRQGGDGRRAGPARGLGPALRLHPHRADQRRDGRAVLHRPGQRAVGAGPRQPADGPSRTGSRRRSPSPITVYFWRVNTKGIHESSDQALEDHGGDHRHGRHHDRLVPGHAGGATPRSGTCRRSTPDLSKKVDARRQADPRPVRQAGRPARASSARPRSARPCGPSRSTATGGA